MHAQHVTFLKSAEPLLQVLLSLLENTKCMPEAVKPQAYEGALATMYVHNDISISREN